MEIKKSICELQNVKPLKPEPNSIIGLATDSLEKGIIHGLRHYPKKNTNGWYIWVGDYSEIEDFFKPVCVEHLKEHIKVDLTEYLDLPPGFRFLLDRNSYKDVWFDESLLKV